MKIVLLAGGYGSRLSEETSIKPKPMVEIGGIPILEHIMNWYMSYGFYEFIICLGYKGSDIISYFKDYNFKNSSCVISENGKIETLNTNKKPWKIILAQTGVKTQTAGRLKKVSKYLSKEEDFMMTYGDGLSNVNLKKLLKFHKKNKKLVTLTAVRPPARFGALKLKGEKVSYFKEKSKLDEGWINGGFFVMEPKFLNFIKNDKTFLEQEPFKILTKKNELLAFKHEGFWQCMDTLRDKKILEDKVKEKNF